MHCPYCDTEYSNERPCFCHPHVAGTELAPDPLIRVIVYPQIPFGLPKTCELRSCRI